MAAAIRPITMPKWGIEMTEGTITAWTAREGQMLRKGEPLLDVETEKIVNSVEAPWDGTLRRILAPQGETRPVGSLIAVFAEAESSESDVEAFIAAFKSETVSFEPESTDARPVTSAPGSAGEAAGSAEGDARMSPATRRHAERLGVDLSKVRGTGRNGRISKEDVDAYAAAREVATPSASGSPADTPHANAETRARISSTRATIARRLVESKQTIPHYRLSIDVDASALMARKRELAGAGSARPTLNDCIVRACALALIKHPALNSRLEGDDIVSLAHADIAIAVATDDGLITPIVRSADMKGIQTIAQETASLAERARGGTLTRDDVAGGSFTISNLGKFGLERFDAIINPPQVAILAVGSASDRVVARSGAAVVSQVMTLTLSCDHRVVDGAVAAAFLATLRNLLESPAGL